MPACAKRARPVHPGIDGRGAQGWLNMRRSTLVAAISVLAVLAPTVRAQDRLFVSSYNADAIMVYPRTATGDLAPSFTIFGASGSGPHQIAVRPDAGEIVVADNRAYSISVYDVASGALVRSISGPSTGIVRPTGVAVDELHGEIFVANDFAGTITVYDVNASGDAAPKRTLVLNLSRPSSVAVDVVHDELIVASASVLGDWIAAFERSATGPVSAKRSIQGPQTTLSLPHGVVLDLLHDEILVANSSYTTPDSGAVLAFGRTDAGDVAPLRTLEGPATQLCNPVGLALDGATDEIVVANSNFGSGSCAESVTTYARTASGNLPPTRTLAGPLTDLLNPTGVAMAPDPSTPTVKVKVKPVDHNVMAGEDVAFVIGTTARGGPVSDVVLKNTLPPGLLWSLGGADASACTFSATIANELTCDFGDLAADETRTIEVLAVSTRSSCPGITNRATVAFHDGTADTEREVAPSSIRIECRTRRPRGGERER